MFLITEEIINPHNIELEFPSSKVGAKSIFEGIVRDNNLGKAVRKLEYQCYKELAIKEGSLILKEALTKYKVDDVFCIHRTGKLEIGETAVLVRVLAANRDDSFQGCRYIIDEVKKRVPIWKKEIYKSGESNWLKGAG